MVRHENYSKSSFEDFLQDDFFIESVKRPTAESVAFWEGFLSEYPGQASAYTAARKFIEDAMAPRLSDKDIGEMWSNIQRASKPTSKPLRRWKFAYSAAAVVAGMVLVAGAYMYFSQRDGSGNDKLLALITNVSDSLIQGDVRLVLSERKTVIINEKESSITYDSATVNTNSEVIRKEEIAVHNELIVPYGKRSVLTLDDGTKIWVNAGTRLMYPARFGKGKREIYVNGEIFLDVAPDTKRPFVVHTKDLSIRVLGTKFNVQAYAGDIQSRVALASGKVRITSDVDEVNLIPNSIYENEGGIASVREADVSKYTSWIDGLYVYESESLRVILKRLARYYGTEIETSASLPEFRCSGKLDLKENIEDVMAVLGNALPVVYLKEGDKYIVRPKP